MMGREATMKQRSCKEVRIRPFLLVLSPLLHERKNHNQKGRIHYFPRAPPFFWYNALEKGTRLPSLGRSRLSVVESSGNSSQIL